MISHCVRHSHPPTHWADIFHPPLPSDCVAIDFPGRASSPSEGLLRPRVARTQKIISLHPLRYPNHLLRGVAKAALYCAHRATTASSWGLCEQEGHLAALLIPPSSLAVSQGWGLIDLPLRVSRNPDAKQVGEAGLAQLGLVYIVCLVGRTGKPTRRTKETNERKRRTTAGEGKIGYLTTGCVVDSMAARIFVRLSASNSCP